MYCYGKSAIMIVTVVIDQIGAVQLPHTPHGYKPSHKHSDKH